MNDDIKKIAALIGHQQTQEARVTALIDAAEKETALLRQENARLLKTIETLSVSSARVTETVRQSVRNSMELVRADLKDAALDSQKPAITVLNELVRDAQQSVKLIRRETNFFSWKSAAWTACVLLFLLCCSFAGLGWFLTTGYDRIAAMQAKEAEWQRKAPLAHIITCDGKPCVEVTGGSYTTDNGGTFYQIKPLK